MFGFRSRWQRRVEEELVHLEQLERQQLLVLIEIRNLLKQSQPPATYPRPASLGVKTS